MAPRSGKSDPVTRTPIEDQPKTSRAHRGEPASLPQPAPPSLSHPRDTILGYLRGLHASHLLAFGEESGAFSHTRQFEPYGISVAELAERTGWNPEYTQFFLETAYALGILDLASEAGVTPRSRYRFGPHAAGLLADDTDRSYMGDAPRFHTLVAQDAKRLPELFRTGKTYPYALHGEDFLRSAAMVTRSLPHLFIETLLPRLPELAQRLEAGTHVLDVGCGAGWAVVQFAERFPKCRILGIDAEPNAIEMAKTLITMQQLTQRAEARLVRGEEIDYEAEFDVATFFLVLHAIPPKQKGTALAHAARALKRDGYLLVVDEAYPETPAEFRDPARGSAVLTQWLEAPWGHRLSTRSEHRALLEQAGLRVQREVDEGRYYAVLAQRS